MIIHVDPDVEYMYMICIQKIHLCISSMTPWSARRRHLYSEGPSHLRQPCGVPCVETREASAFAEEWKRRQSFPIFCDMRYECGENHITMEHHHVFMGKLTKFIVIDIIGKGKTIGKPWKTII